jgi:hypothetical protein
MKDYALKVPCFETSIPNNEMILTLIRKTGETAISVVLGQRSINKETVKPLVALRFINITAVDIWIKTLQAVKTEIEKQNIKVYKEFD